MATRRRVGFSTSTSEASRRQLMQPVPCWEKAWVLPEKAAPGTTLKVYKWVKTEKVQQFSDDEGETDQPLAPLPDDPEVIDGDEEMDQDDAANRDSTVPETTPASRAVSEPAASKLDEGSKPASPKPHPLSISFQPASPTPATDDVLDESLMPMETSEVQVDDISADVSLNLAEIDPDTEPFDATEDISQLQEADDLLGGSLIDEGMTDPFVMPE